MGTRSRAAAADASWPVAEDFASPPTAGELARWEEADRVARPARVARVRARLTDQGLDAYFGVRREHMRYLTGIHFDEGEEKVAGHSGQFLIGGEEIVVLADSRYTIQANREAAGARVEPVTYDLAAR